MGLFLVGRSRVPHPVADVAPGSTLYDTLRAGLISNPDQHEGVVYRTGRFVMANDWITLYANESDAMDTFDEAVEYFSQPAWSVK